MWDSTKGTQGVALVLNDVGVGLIENVCLSAKLVERGAAREFTAAPRSTSLPGRWIAAAPVTRIHHGFVSTSRRRVATRRTAPAVLVVGSVSGSAARFAAVVAYPRSHDAARHESEATTPGTARPVMTTSTTAVPPRDSGPHASGLRPRRRGVLRHSTPPPPSSDSAARRRPLSDRCRRRRSAPAELSQPTSGQAAPPVLGTTPRDRCAIRSAGSSRRRDRPVHRGRAS